MNGKEGCVAKRALVSNITNDFTLPATVTVTVNGEPVDVEVIIGMRLHGACKKIMVNQCMGIRDTIHFVGMDAPTQRGALRPFRSPFAKPHCTVRYVLHWSGGCGVVCRIGARFNPALALRGFFFFLSLPQNPAGSQPSG